MTILGLLFRYTMNPGAPQGDVEDSMTPNCIHVSICLSMTSRFAGELGKGGRDTSLTPGRSGIVHSEATVPSLPSSENASLLDIRTSVSRRCWSLFNEVQMSTLSKKDDDGVSSGGASEVFGPPSKGSSASGSSEPCILCVAFSSTGLD